MKHKSKEISYFFFLSIYLMAFFAFSFKMQITHAGLLDIINSEAKADNSYYVKDKKGPEIELLETNISYIDILEQIEEKDEDKDKKDNKKDEIIDENININTTDSALIPEKAFDIMSLNGENSEEINIYLIREGDTIKNIAEMFDVSINTILWANDIKMGDKLIPGETLLILPISGIEHEITKGQTLAKIANFYKVDVLDIARFNGITEETELVLGEKIIIPNGEIVSETLDQSKKIAANPETFNKQVDRKFVKLSNYFINPTPGARRSQGLHGKAKRGIDLAAPPGTNVLASASGSVIFAKKGWNGAYGNLVIIKHNNGTKTLYAHLSKIKTKYGSKVEQGEIIGLVGSTGRSTGPHLHFEVFNAKNPGSDWSWKKR